MLAEVISEAIRTGKWCSVDVSSVQEGQGGRGKWPRGRTGSDGAPSSLPVTETEARNEGVDSETGVLAVDVRRYMRTSLAAIVGEVLVAFAHDGPLGTLNVWLALPLLPTLLAYGGLRSQQRAVMSLNVLLKTDEAQSAGLAALPDRSWIRLFVAMAVLGERSRQQATALAAETVTSSSAKVGGRKCDSSTTDGVLVELGEDSDSCGESLVIVDKNSVGSSSNIDWNDSNNRPTDESTAAVWKAEVIGNM